MENIDQISKVLNVVKSQYSETFSNEKYMERQLEFIKSAKGKGACSKCNGLGFIPELIDGNIYMKPCKCQIAAINSNRLRKSGLEDLINLYTFDKFKTDEEWQATLKERALAFVENPKGWFFVSGQPGCGKTHICTAIVKVLMDKGMESRYVIWPNEIVKLKANKNNDEEYSRLIGPLQTVPVLYIDDFFKTAKKEAQSYDTDNCTTKQPTNSDVTTAFEILNYRYNNRNKLITIISSEKNIDEIMDYDEALGSRIYEMSKGARSVIKFENGRNYRINGRQ